MYMKNFINEFKAFIMRGNVVDLLSVSLSVLHLVKSSLHSSTMC